MTKKKEALGRKNGLPPVQPTTPGPAANEAGSANGTKPTYFDGVREGRQRAQDEQQQNEQARREAQALDDARAASRIILEFGDSIITIRDGMERIIQRVPYTNWAGRIGELMAARNCREYSTRMAEHSHFTMRQAILRTESERRVEGAAEGMQVEGFNK